jgi:hypothetical protein
MKIQHFLLIALIILTIDKIGTAQPRGKNFTLNTPTTSGYYIARDSIKLAPGFFCSPSGGSYFVAEIDYSTIQPNINRSLDLSLTVGSTTGSFDVGPTGAASYNIPLTVPPGAAGMQPEISIGYNSQGVNGLLGIGWNLYGLSTITRVPTTIFNDGVIDPVDLDANDKFALD